MLLASILLLLLLKYSNQKKAIISASPIQSCQRLTFLSFGVILRVVTKLVLFPSYLSTDRVQAACSFSWAV